MNKVSIASGWSRVTVISGFLAIAAASSPAAPLAGSVVCTASSSCTTTWTPAAGNRLVVWYENHDSDVSTPPSSSSVTFTQIAADSRNTWHAHVRIFVSTPIPNAVPIVVNAPQPLTHLVVAEFSGFSANIDTAAQTAGYNWTTGACPNMGALSLTTTSPNDLILTGYADAADGGTVFACSHASGAVIPGHPGCSNNNSFVPTYQFASTPATYTQAFSVVPNWNGGTNSCVMVALKPADPPSLPAPPTLPMPPGPTGGWTVTATAKGPNQINLTWAAQPDPGYGYIVEIQSPADSRYASFTEIAPIPAATGYMCDPNANWAGRGTGCNISDPSGVHVHNPLVNGVPSWVTEPQYIDPQDGTPAQFIVTGLKNQTAYNFRVRTYSGNTDPTYGAYSATASATTNTYTLRYVSNFGNDGNDGSAPDSAHAWRTISRANSVACGTAVVVLGGNYDNEYVGLYQSCTPTTKVVLMANPGDTATITSNAHPDWGAVLSLGGINLVVDGLRVSINGDTDYAVKLNGTHNALLNLSAGPNVIPSSYGGVIVGGSYGLVYRSYLHDYGSPYSDQNPAGNGGFVLTVQGPNNVFWSNHLTRGGHDTSLCHSGCAYNRWLNNIFDGGWGMAFETVYNGASYNLFEGGIARDPGVLESGIYKPGFELSYSNNVVRRNIFAGSAPGAIGKAIEISAYDTTVGNLVYNNVFYNVARCYFQSHNYGASAYEGVKVQNNICQFTGDVSEIYLNNMTPGAISYNSLRLIGGTGTEPVVRWYLDGGYIPYQVSQTLDFTESNYAPVWQMNAAISRQPVQFVNPAAMDFHLAPGSALRGVGTRVIDGQWGISALGTIDLGAYGLNR